MEKLKNISNTDLQEIFDSNSSIRGILIAIGVKRPSSNIYRKELDKKVAEFGLSLEKFLINKKNRKGRKETLEEVLVENKRTNNQRLKIKLILSGLKSDKCEKCGIGPEWNGKNLTLQLDHINGDNCDNRIENICIVCPNCHSQTDTFAGRNVKKKKKKEERQL